MYLFEFLLEVFSNESNRIKESNEISLKTLIGCGYIKVPRVGLCWEDAVVHDTSNALIIDKIYDSSKRGMCIDLDTKFNIYLKHIIFSKSRFYTEYHSSNRDAEDVFTIIIVTDLDIKGVSVTSNSSEVLLNIWMPLPQ